MLVYVSLDSGVTWSTTPLHYAYLPVGTTGTTTGQYTTGLFTSGTTTGQVTIEEVTTGVAAETTSTSRTGK